MGEYAVVDGAPALVAAVNRGVACVTFAHDQLQIQTPADDRFVRPALQACGAPPGLYQFTDHNPPNTKTKAGFGGSASATVAAILAGTTLAGSPLPPAELHAMAHDVHYRVQGSGSGIDIAAAVWGGVLAFEAGGVIPYPKRPVSVAYSGSSAATGPRVQQYLAWSRAHPADHQAFLADSAALTKAFDADPVTALNEARRLLTYMTARAGIDYWTPGLTALCDLAIAHGGAAKPSGAGGGDIVVALFPSPLEAQDWQRACTQRGFVVIPVEIADGATELR